MKKRNYPKYSFPEKIFVTYVILWVTYLFIQWYRDRELFWDVLIYGIIVIIAVIMGTIAWKEFKYRQGQKRLNKFLEDIHEFGLEEYVHNFIKRFGLSKKKSRVWRYRNYSFTWGRLEDFRKFLRSRGVRVALGNWNDLSLILKHFIREREEKLTRESIGAPTGKFSDLSAYDFEILMYRLFEAMGYSVQHTGKAGDQGADLIANKGKERILIQAKRYLSSSVGNNSVQQAIAAKNHYDCNIAVVVATSNFTQAAIDVSETNNVRLINKKRLQELLIKYLKERWN